MTAKIKLNAASGGGSFSIQAPSSSSNNRVITLPDIADGTLLTNQSTGLGKFLKTVQTVKTDTFSESLGANTNSSTNSIAVTISPSSSSSYVLIVAMLSGSSSYWTGTSGGGWGGRIVRGSTNIGIGDAAGSRVQQTFRSGAINNSNNVGMCFVYFLDTGISTTNATTYGVRLDNLDNGTRTMFLNRSPNDSDSATNSYRPISTLTAIEVAPN